MVARTLEKPTNQPTFAAIKSVHPEVRESSPLGTLSLVLCMFTEAHFELLEALHLQSRLTGPCGQLEPFVIT